MTNSFDQSPVDDIFAKRIKVADFAFNAEVTRVFPNMISRSVPAYQEVIAGIADIINATNFEHTNIYDLGCSVGTTAIYLATALTKKTNNIIGIDNSVSMIAEANKNLSNFKESKRSHISFQQQDVLTTKMTQASVVILNYTLQFLPVATRQELLAKIYQALLPNGILIISEKVQFSGARVNKIIDNMHLAFKKHNGYSDLEISQKRASLEKVMIPDSIDQHYQRLQLAGFAEFGVWQQKYNFLSLLAVK